MKWLTALLTLAAFTMSSSAIAQSSTPSNLIPMYGGESKPESPPNKEWSKNASDLGWKYFYADDLDTAMKRFNQAWLLDKSNPDAFWGFGIVEGKKAQNEPNPEDDLNSAVHFLGIAQSMNSQNPTILIDEGRAYSFLGR